MNGAGIAKMYKQKSQIVHSNKRHNFFKFALISDVSNLDKTKRDKLDFYIKLEKSENMLFSAKPIRKPKQKSLTH